ncbi:AcrR family transcriptional regulator [Mesorhizobium soli]|uniref:TetR/AcrR family transcriptional regulator n=1 Tax=Pseudaminobacter soli (ex Li et al. 2025) TaxID=1295366 RepID=UPI00247589BD|nr:helix-turn-helix domain-containing protein [Mesorhizobium soli]MDH6232284.1 AcrR family transcriptional regulator [Mesorhizobium soli]
MIDPSRTAMEPASSARRLEPKERLFDAAIYVALENGFGKVTLDAIARRAGVSKGGLLHHFATKKDLIRAMLKHFADAASDRHLAGIAVDLLAIAALVAAAEDTLLLETISTKLDLPRSDLAGAEHRTTQLALASGFASRLCLRGACHINEASEVRRQQALPLPATVHCPCGVAL